MGLLFEGGVRGLHMKLKLLVIVAAMGQRVEGN